MLADVDALAEADGIKRSAAMQLMIKRGFAQMRLAKELSRELTWEELLAQGRANEEKIQQKLKESCEGITVRKKPKKPEKAKKEAKK